MSEVPAIVFKKQQRRTRKDFTAEEINYLLDGIKKMGHHWNSILWAYPFQKGRTNVDLAKKYFKLKVLLFLIYFTVPFCIFVVYL